MYVYRNSEVRTTGLEFLPKGKFDLIYNLSDTQNREEEIQKAFGKLGIKTYFKEITVDVIELHPGSNSAEAKAYSGKKHKLNHLLRKLERLVGKPIIDKSGLEFIPGDLPTYGTAEGLDFALKEKAYVNFVPAKAKIKMFVIERTSK